ncbi:hypothetical protein [Actinoplanes auranticolor]|uniref:Uncharacterized protein n=1 Tax=Actinoplanes auranticolor TaxID=47988 RepID=A0A919S8V1_9ACTN|nr:hypothetical protein [Actinoplanes auranticolor]GIM65753.1 hypothetical protein Aau02nite_19480 [Actinoplanes auranticolor]
MSVTSFPVALWIELLAAGLGGLQGALFAAGERHRRIDVLGVIVIGLAGSRSSWDCSAGRPALRLDLSRAVRIPAGAMTPYHLCTGDNGSSFLPSDGEVEIHAG